MPRPTSPASRRKIVRFASVGALAALALGGPLSGAAQAAVQVPPLGTATAFSVLAGSTVTNTGATAVSRSVGLAPGTAVTGSGTMVVGGTYHVADGVASTAKDNLTAAYVNAAGQTPRNASDEELGGETLLAGVYNRAADMALTGALTLDGGKTDGTTSDSIWVFQAGAALTVANASSIVLTGGANPCNVYWQVGSSATLGTTVTFVGTIMALTTITMNDGTTLAGRALARNGAVNLHRNVITSPNCANDTTVEAGTTTPPPVATATPTPTPTPTPTGTTGTNGGTGSAGGSTSDTTADTTGTTTTQVTATPTGAVDTGYIGPLHSSDDSLGGLYGGALFALVGGLALFAVRRRQRG
ncbi:MAG: hypothetical protein JWR90_2684 [Marmoricola sp.]|nr:hypothetical protein [Marmoricola sp.]